MASTSAGCSSRGFLGLHIWQYLPPLPIAALQPGHILDPDSSSHSSGGLHPGCASLIWERTRETTKRDDVQSGNGHCLP